MNFMGSWRIEWRLVARETTFRAAWLFVVLLIAAALWSGSTFQQARDAQAEASVSRSLEKREQQKATFRAEESGTTPQNPWWPSEPTRADWNAARPSGPLAGLTVGQEDLYPLSGPVSLWITRPDTLFRKYQFDSPLVLAAGRFDATFVVLLLLPLLVLVLSYDLVAQESETGRIRLMLAQAGEAWRPLMRRFLLRLSPVVAALAGIAIFGLVLGWPVGRLALWLLAATLYLALWAGGALWIGTLPYRRAALAMIGLGAWLFVGVIAPGLVLGLSRALVPAPSSFALINEARTAEGEANRRMFELLQIYVHDHPEMLDGKPTEDDWSAKLYLVQQEVTRAIELLRTEHRSRIARQHELAERFRFLSPALLAQHVFATTAGSDAARQQSYVEQTEAFLRRWQETLSPLIFRRQRLTAADIDTLPCFEFREPAIAPGPVLFSLGAMLVVAIPLVRTARRRLQRTTTQLT